MLTLLLILLTSFIAGSGCRHKDIPTGDFAQTVFGTVTDSVSGLPIDSARVTFSDTNLTVAFHSDSTGFYQFATFGVYNLLIFVQKSGYQTASRTITSGFDSVEVNFLLAPL